MCSQQGIGVGILRVCRNPRLTHVFCKDRIQVIPKVFRKHLEGNVSTTAFEDQLCIIQKSWKKVRLVIKHFLRLFKDLVCLIGFSLCCISGIQARIGFLVRRVVLDDIDILQDCVIIIQRGQVVRSKIQDLG